MCGGASAPAHPPIMTRYLTLTLAMLALIAGLYITDGALTDDPPVALRTIEADPVELDRLIGVYHGHVASDQPGSFFSATLGHLLLQRASAANDLDDYQQAAVHLEAAYDASGDDAAGLALARAQIALHRFDDAIVTLSATSGDIDPVEHDLASFDAHLGVGDLDRAGTSLTPLERRFPGEPVVQARRAELTYLSGDGNGAAQLASEAADIAASAGLSRREQSFYDLSAAKFLLAIGESRSALERSTAATVRTPDHPGAWLLRARAEAAGGDVAAAITSAEQSVTVAATPASLSFLADLYVAVGDVGLAEVQLSTIEAIAALDQQVLRRDVALARADHGRNLTDALSAAQAELASRPDAYSHHVLATALHATGDLAGAERHATAALGLPDPEVWFRAGVIAFDAGDRDAAERRLRHALELAPNFHPLKAPVARTLLEELQS